MAALGFFPDAAVAIVPCAHSADVFAALVARTVDLAALPIENSLHGSVAEHYDLLLQQPVEIIRERLLRIRFHLIAMPGVVLGDLKRVLSHPVALAQCRGFFAAHREIEAVPFYDTAGSVKYLMAAQLTDTAGIAPELAADEYGATIIERDLEDHADNFTRFLLLTREHESASFRPTDPAEANKITIAFSVEHRPGTLVQALQSLASAGVDLTRIESRPVPGSPWEYVFYVEFRFGNRAQAEAALSALRPSCRMLKELGRYRAAQ